MAWPEPRSPIRLAVVDDQSVVREALAVMLDLDPDVDVVATASDGAQAVAIADTVRPDVILLDLTMPVLDGLGALRRIHRDHPDIVVLVLTTYAEDALMLAAIEAGASGYLTKDANRGTILRAIREATSPRATTATTTKSRTKRVQ